MGYLGILLNASLLYIIKLLSEFSSFSSELHTETQAFTSLQKAGCTSVYVCVCVWLKKMFTSLFSGRRRLPLFRSPLLSHRPCFSLLLDLAGSPDSPWPNDHHSWTVCTCYTKITHDHHCRRSSSPIFQSFFHLAFFLFSHLSADFDAQKSPPALT